MKKIFFVILLPALLLLSATGCTRVRTYAVEKDRVDQQLESGNQGFLAGTPKESDITKPRKLTRKTYVTEIEVGRYSSQKKSVKSGMQVETVQEPESQPITEQAPQEEGKTAQTEKVTNYTVGPNETLGSISLKVYGTAKKWKKIYEANADQLKSPDKIYAGQTLKIPQE
ncbi:MAG: LysM peptidoglycan-binding domain-containing protein [Candidatus Omnitrophica bacterium]|nr:LysM peptidoglycan-binding domain-containing protein [Candidatus Omnitrophota bacterium]